jgi:hypothetical protein
MPTTRTAPGARSDAASEEYVAAPPRTSRCCPVGMSRSSNAMEPMMRRGFAEVDKMRASLGLPKVD